MFSPPIDARRRCGNLALPLACLSRPLALCLSKFVEGALGGRFKIVSRSGSVAAVSSWPLVSDGTERTPTTTSVTVLPSTSSGASSIAVRSTGLARPPTLSPFGP